MKKFSAIALLLSVALLSATTAFAKVNIQFAHTGSLEHQYHIAAVEFKKLVEERSKGEITVTIFPQAQLGSEREAIEGVRMGTINMTSIAANGALPNWVPELQVLAVPYLFKTREQVYAVLDGPFGEKMGDLLKKKGFILGGFGEVGFRNFTNNKAPIIKPSDMAGMKIRVQESKIWIELIKSLGGIPTPVPFDELYTALQQGVVDGEENPIATVMSMKFYEVQKYISLDRHTYEASAFLINPKWLAKLPQASQELILTAVKDSIAYQRKYLTEKENDQLSMLVKNGVTVTEEPDFAAFSEATKDMDKVFASIVPGGETLVEELKGYIAAVK